MILVRLHGLLREALGTDLVEITGEPRVTIEELLRGEGPLTGVLQSGISPEDLTVVVDGQLRKSSWPIPDGSTVDLLVAVDGG